METRIDPPIYFPRHGMCDQCDKLSSSMRPLVRPSLDCGRSCKCFCAPCELSSSSWLCERLTRILSLFRRCCGVLYFSYRVHVLGTSIVDWRRAGSRVRNECAPALENWSGINVETGFLITSPVVRSRTCSRSFSERGPCATPTLNRQFVGQPLANEFSRLHPLEIVSNVVRLRFVIEIVC